MFSQKAFADFFKIDYPLLSGGRNVTAVHKVLKAYGVFDEAALNAKRAYLIIDKDGVLRYKNIPPTPREPDLVPTETLLNEIRKINRAG
jgi:peroxiredoxin